MVKWKALLYGYWQLHCSFENRWYLQKHCRRCWKKICLKEKIKINWTHERGIRRTIHERMFGLRAKPYGYLKEKKTAI